MVLLYLNEVQRDEIIALNNFDESSNEFNETI